MHLEELLELKKGHQIVEEREEVQIEELEISLDLENQEGITFIHVIRLL